MSEYYKSKHAGADIDKAVELVNSGGLKVTYSNSSPTPATFGGIKAGTTFENVSVEDMFNKLLYPYQSPSIASLSLSPSDTKIKLPATFELKSITHKETNIGNISGNLTLKRGSTVVKSGIAPSSTDSTIIVSDTVKLTTSGVTYTLSGTDTEKKSFSKNVTINTYYTSYYGVSTAEIVSNELIVNLIDTNSASLKGTKTVAISESAKYIWFITTQTINSITSGGFAVPYTLVNSSFSYNGGSYKCYRTTEKALVGENKFDIA